MTEAQLNANTGIDEAEKEGIQKAFGAAVERAKAAYNRLLNPDDLTDKAFKIIIGENWSDQGLKTQYDVARSTFYRLFSRRDALALTSCHLEL